MDDYALIMRHEDGHKVASPEQIHIWMNQTMEWISGIDSKNKFVQGIGLTFNDSNVVRPKNIVAKGPFGDLKDTIGGIIIIKSDSPEEAVEFAKGCPVLQGEGNSVEVRKIAKDDGVH